MSTSGGWQGRKVVIVGAARQGLALARYLVLHGAQVTLTDRRPASEMQFALEALVDLSVQWVFGGHPIDMLQGVDILCLSGGVPLDTPLVVAAHTRGIQLSNDSQIFLEAAPCKAIGITGSAGKTTTTTLVGLMASLALSESEVWKIRTPYQRVWVGGNIGSPLIADVDRMQSGDLAVMELSSFQLEIMTCSPQVAAVLNVTPNHLDRHSTMETYTAAKAHILEFQSASDAAILGRDDPGTWSLVNKNRGRLYSFGLSELAEGQEGAFYLDGHLYLRESGNQVCLMSQRDIQLRGQHNLYNVLAACAIALAAGLPTEAMREAVMKFRGVAHRLEWVRSWRGADWYNDSIATAPERAMAAIRSFEEPLVLMAGGRDKNLPWENFAHMVSRRVKHLILFGEAAEKIERSVLEVISTSMGSNEKPKLKMTRCQGLRQAVQAAARIVEPGDVVLLAPGGTSFDEFKDFEERGLCFVRWVNDLN